MSFVLCIQLVYGTSSLKHSGNDNVAVYVYTLHLLFQADISTVNLLLELGAKVNMESKDRKTALIYVSFCQMQNLNISLTLNILFCFSCRQDISFNNAI